jgi:ribonuclease VapC
MVIDTSAILAILLGEPEALDFAREISDDPKRLVAAFTVLECAVVIEARKGPYGARELDLLLHEVGIETVAMDNEQIALAREAYRRFGKGRDRAQLNLGDCCTYALSKQSGEPLLFKGEDFTHTDIRSVPLR